MKNYSLVVIAILLWSQSHLHANDWFSLPEPSQVNVPTYVGGILLGTILTQGAHYFLTPKGPSPKQVLKEAESVKKDVCSRHAATIDAYAKLDIETEVLSNHVETFAIKLSRKSDVESYLSQFKNDVEALEQAQELVIDALKKSPTKDERERLLTEQKTLSDLGGNLKILASFIDAHQAELEYLVYERNLQQELMVFPQGRPESTSLYRALSQLDDLNAKEKQLIDHMSRVQIDTNDQSSFLKRAHVLRDKLSKRRNQLESSREYKQDLQMYREIEPTRQFEEKRIEIERQKAEAMNREASAIEERNVRLNGLEAQIKTTGREFSNARSELRNVVLATQVVAVTVGNSARATEDAAHKLANTAGNVHEIAQGIKRANKKLDEVAYVVHNVDAQLNRPPAHNPASNLPAPSAPPMDAELYPDLSTYE